MLSSGRLISRHSLPPLFCVAIYLPFYPPRTFVFFCFPFYNQLLCAGRGGLHALSCLLFIHLYVSDNVRGGYDEYSYNLLTIFFFFFSFIFVFIFVCICLRLCYVQIFYHPSGFMKGWPSTAAHPLGSSSLIATAISK